MSTWYALYPHLGGGRGTYPGVQSRLKESGYCHIPGLAGRDGRYLEPAHRRFGALADDLWGQLEECLADGRDSGDLVLFGFSMGALLATELASRLQSLGRPPRGLVVGGCPPPDRLDSAARLADREDTAFVAGLAAHGMMTEQMRADRDFIALMLPIWRADCAAVESHPGTAISLDCEVVAFGGQDDPLLSESALRAWAEVAPGRSSTFVLPGGHRLDDEIEEFVVRLIRGVVANSAPVGG